MRIVNDNSVLVDATFTEPDQNSDGTPLQDLDFSTIYYSEGGTEESAQVSASNLMGGQEQTLSLMLPVLRGTTKTFTFWATSTDVKGNESLKSDSVVFTIDRQTPNPPSNFFVQ